MRKKFEIKTLWFDLGNVVLNFDFTPAFKRLSRYTAMTPTEIRAYFRAHPSLEAGVDEGRVGATTLFRRIHRDLKLRGVGFRRFKAIWNDIFNENRPVARLLKRLKKNGYRLVLISNTNRLHYEYILGRYRVLKLFDAVVLSFRVRARKPKKKIYREALEVSNAAPAEIFYTDDRMDLTNAAYLDHGIHTHTYRSLRELKKALRRLRVRIS